MFLTVTKLNPWGDCLLMLIKLQMLAGLTEFSQMAPHLIAVKKQSTCTSSLITKMALIFTAPALSSLTSKLSCFYSQWRHVKRKLLDNTFTHHFHKCVSVDCFALKPLHNKDKKVTRSKKAFCPLFCFCFLLCFIPPIIPKVQHF